MNIHQLYGKAVSAPVWREYRQGDCYAFTFLYYSLAPFSRRDMQANFVEVEMPPMLYRELENIQIEKNRFLLSGFFYQNRWQDEKGIFHTVFRFYAQRIEPLNLEFARSAS